MEPQRSIWETLWLAKHPLLRRGLTTWCRVLWILSLLLRTGLNTVPRVPMDPQGSI